jgi:hypothetical protein
MKALRTLLGRLIGAGLALGLCVVAPVANAQTLSAGDLFAFMDKVRSAPDNADLQASIAGRPFRAWMRLSDWSREAIDLSYSAGEWEHIIEAGKLKLNLNQTTFSSADLPSLVPRSAQSSGFAGGLNMGTSSAEAPRGGADRIAYFLLEHQEAGVTPVLGRFTSPGAEVPMQSSDPTEGGLMVLVEGTVLAGPGPIAQCGVRASIRACAVSVRIGRIAVVARGTSDEPFAEAGPRAGQPLDRSDMPPPGPPPTLQAHVIQEEEYTAVGDGIRAAIEARRAHSQRGQGQMHRGDVEVQLTFEPGPLTSEANRRIAAAVVDQLDFLPSSFGLTRIDSRHFRVTFFIPSSSD